MRLQAVRPDWPWKEEIDPDALASERRPIGQIEEPGIYNRAVIMMAEKSRSPRDLRGNSATSRNSRRKSTPKLLLADGLTARIQTQHPP